MKKGNTKLLILVALLAVVVVAMFMLPSPVMEEETTSEVAMVAIDDQAPEFTVELTNGQSISLEELRGKVVLLTFWATWCPPCQSELARAQGDLINRFAGRDFVFLPISRGEERATVERFLAENGYNFPAGIDADKSIYESYADTSIPRNYLINRHGVVIDATVGYSPEEFDNLLRHIEMALMAR